MNIAFTICSNNYLAQARTLGESLLRENPDWLFFICLCDKKRPEVEYAPFAPQRVIEATELGVAAFGEMCGRYSIIELNTSLKAFAFTYFYRTFPEAERVIYFDPDIGIYAPLHVIEEELAGSAALLTPHILTPLEFDGETPDENTFTQFGTYNLGFLATARDERLFPFLGWWQRRLQTNCFIRPDKGIFVDQLPMNLAVVFFEGLKVSRNFGLNMAPWNLHERRLSQRNGRYFVNETTPLVFYHFSKFRPGGDLSRTNYSRLQVGDEVVFLALNEEYERRLLNNDFEKLRSLPCAYGLRAVPPQKSFGAKLARSVKKRLGLMPKSC